MLRILGSKTIACVIGAILYAGTTAVLWRGSEKHVGESTPSTEEHAPSGPSWTFVNPEVDELVADLKNQIASLGTRKKDLDELATRLQTERLELNQATQTVFRLQSEFDHNVIRAREEETGNLKRLAKMFSGMTPEGATTILKELEDPTVVKVMMFMKDSETAAILEMLAKGGEAEAKRAAAITELLRMASPPPSAKRTP